MSSKEIVKLISKKTSKIDFVILLLAVLVVVVGVSPQL